MNVSVNDIISITPETEVVTIEGKQSILVVADTSLTIIPKGADENGRACIPAAFTCKVVDLCAADSWDAVHYQGVVTRNGVSQKTTLCSTEAEAKGMLIRLVQGF